MTCVIWDLRSMWSPQIFLQTGILIPTMFLSKDLSLTFYHFFRMRVLFLWVLFASFLLFAWLTSSSFHTSLIRALLLAVLKSHITIFSITNYKNKTTLTESKPNILASQLQYITTFGCVWQLIVIYKKYIYIYIFYIHGLIILIMFKYHSLFFFSYSPPLPQFSFTHFAFFLKLPSSNSFLNPTVFPYNGPLRVSLFFLFLLRFLTCSLKAPYLFPFIEDPFSRQTMQGPWFGFFALRLPFKFLGINKLFVK